MQAVQAPSRALPHRWQARCRVNSQPVVAYSRVVDEAAHHIVNQPITPACAERKDSCQIPSSGGRYGAQQEKRKAERTQFRSDGRAPVDILHQKMALNSSSDIPLLTLLVLRCGLVLDEQLGPIRSLSGRQVPMSGCHPRSGERNGSGASPRRPPPSKTSSARRRAAATLPFTEKRHPSR